MKKIADKISESGHIPGIWLAPFICEEQSNLFKNNKHWLIYTDDENFVRGGSNWSGFYALDINNPEVREYIRFVIETLVNEWGYKLLKLDFLYAACIVS